MLPKKVLIIDDEKMIRLTTGFLIKKKGMEAIEAAGGEQGLALLEQQRPDMVLLDIMMPLMDGWEVLKKIRASKDFSQIPVVIFTAGDFLEAKKNAKDAGIQGLVRKPFHIEELLKVLDTAGEGGTYGQ